MLEEELTGGVIGAAIEVHKYWGPGLYEEIYDRSMCCELKIREIPFESQFKMPFIYKGNAIGDELKLDLMIDSSVVLELKAVKNLAKVHEAQLLTCMRLTKCRIGLLINFNVPVLKLGIKRMML